MQRIKNLKINFNVDMVFQIPTDIVIDEITVKSMLEYNSTRYLKEPEIEFIIKFFKDNPVNKYPLIKNYYVFYNFIIDKFMDNRNVLKDEYFDFFTSISPGYNYNKINEGEEGNMDSILNSPKFSYLYSLDRKNKIKNISSLSDVRWKEGEWIISRSPEYAAEYLINIIYPTLISTIPNVKHHTVLNIIKEKFKSFEDSILTDSYSTLKYVKGVIGDIYPRGEKIIFSSDFSAQQYVTDIAYDSILKAFEGDHEKTRKEIRQRYRDFDNYIIGKTDKTFISSVVENYLEKIIFKPDPNVEKKMVEAGKEVPYFEFLKKYYSALEYKKNLQLSREEKIQNIGNEIIKNVNSNLLVKMAKNFIDNEGVSYRYSYD